MRAEQQCVNRESIHREEKEKKRGNKYLKGEKANGVSFTLVGLGDARKPLKTPASRESGPRINKRDDWFICSLWSALSCQSTRAVESESRTSARIRCTLTNESKKRLAFFGKFRGAARSDSRFRPDKVLAEKKLRTFPRCIPETLPRVTDEASK